MVPPPRRLAAHVLIGGYLALQVALGARGLVTDKLESRGDFSWNMYAHTYTCSVTYTVHAADGTLDAVDFEAAFRNERSSTKVLHRDRLPRFHAWLCRERVPAGGQLFGLVSCRLNGGRWTDLVDPSVDLCRAPRHGVR